MNLFQLDADTYSVIWEPQALLLAPFAAIKKRCKSNLQANKELAFVYFYCDIKSDYNHFTDLKEKEEAIKADLKLSKAWKIDRTMEKAIEYYEGMSTSITSQILKDSTAVASKLSSKMKEAASSDDLDVTEIDKLLGGLKKLPDVIKALQAAEAAVLKEIKEGNDRLGSREKAEFEDGL